jgi:hypothetical protein
MPVPTDRLDSERASIGRMAAIEMHTGIWQILPPMRFQPPALSLSRTGIEESQRLDAGKCCSTWSASSVWAC